MQMFFLGEEYNIRIHDIYEKNTLEEMSNSFPLFYLFTIAIAYYEICKYIEMKSYQREHTFLNILSMKRIQKSSNISKKYLMYQKSCSHIADIKW